MGKAKKYIGKVITRATQRTVRFIRWLQAALYRQGSLSEAIAMLERVWCPKNHEPFHTNRHISLRPGVVAGEFDEFGFGRDLVAPRDDDAGAALEGNVHLLFDRVLNGDLEKSKIADGPSLVELVRSHPVIILDTPRSAKIGREVVFGYTAVSQDRAGGGNFGSVNLCL